MSEEKISEKTASDLKDAAKSVQTAGTMGIYGQLISLVGMIASLVSNPYMETFTKFYETLQKFYSAETAENVAAINRHLYNEDNIKFWQDLTAAIAHFGDGAGDAIISIGDLVQIMDALAIALPHITKAWDDMWVKFGLGMRDVVVSISDLPNQIREGFEKAMKKIDWAEIVQDIIEAQFD